MFRLAPLGDPRCWDYPGYPNIKQLALTEPALYWWRGTTPDWASPPESWATTTGPRTVGPPPPRRSEGAQLSKAADLGVRLARPSHMITGYTSPHIVLPYAMPRPDTSGLALTVLNSNLNFPPNSGAALGYSNPTQPPTSGTNPSFVV